MLLGVEIVGKRKECDFLPKKSKSLKGQDGVTKHAMTLVYRRFVAKSKTEPLDVKEYDFICSFYATPCTQKHHWGPKTGAGAKSDHVGRPRTVNAVMTEERLKDIETRFVVKCVLMRW